MVPIHNLLPLISVPHRSAQIEGAVSLQRKLLLTSYHSTQLGARSLPNKLDFSLPWLYPDPCGRDQEG